MRVFFFFAFFLLILSSYCLGQSDSAGFKNDLVILRTALSSNHPSMYRFTPKLSFDRLYDSIDAQITSKTSSRDFFRMISKIDSYISEGHTYINPSAKLTRFARVQGVFPFQLTFSSGKAIIRKSLGDTNKSYEGSEILSINGKNIDSVLLQIGYATGLKSGCNRSGLLDVLSIGNNFAFAYYFFVEDTNLFSIEAMPLSGKEKQHFRAAGISVDPTTMTYPEYQKEKTPPVSFQVIQAGIKKVAVMKITTFANWIVSYKRSDYYKFFERSFARISRENISELIIDLRDNRGGDEMLAMDLFTYLYDKEFTMYEYIKMNSIDFSFINSVPGSDKKKFAVNDYLKTDSGYFKIKDRLLDRFSPKTKNHYRGNLYFISNGGSRSATNTLLALAKTYSVGRIVGSESGGILSEVDGHSRINFHLPHSGMFVSFPVWTLKINSGGGDPKRGVSPDDVIQKTGEQIFSGEDVEKDFILKRIREK